MGLLTSSGGDGRQGRLATLLTKHAGTLCVLAYVAGFIWLVMLAWAPASARTYFSENALLPGLVKRDFNLGSHTVQLLESLTEEANHSSPSIPFAWLQAQFRQLGLEVYFHNFTLHYPFGRRPKYFGKNLYAILRAPRSSGVEALVLSTPYRSGHDTLTSSTLPGIALMLSLAKFFRKRTFWAKDIIFLITEHELVGFEAWLEAYHGHCHSPEVLNCGSLPGRSGAIQAAINLEIPQAERPTHVEVEVAGINGHLPNLDLFNLAVELCGREGVGTTIGGGRFDHPADGVTWDGWQHALRTLAANMAIQAAGLPTAAHGIFTSFSVQALTLRGMSSNKYPNRITLHHMARVVEGIFRSLNNLLERLHQSYFFYLLPSTGRFVSIGLYMMPFSLLALPLLVKALTIYLNLGGLPSKEDKKDQGDQSISQDPIELILKSERPSLWDSLGPVSLCHAGGALALITPQFLDVLPSWLGQPLENTLFLVATIYSVLLLLLLPCLLKFRKLTEDKKKSDQSVLECMALLQMGLFLYTLSLVNISLAFVLALLYVPVVATRPTRFLLRVLRGLLLLALHPLLLLFLILLALSFWSDPEETSVGEHLSRAHTGLSRVLLYSLEDWKLYANWNFVAASSILLPLWHHFWLLA